MIARPYTQEEIDTILQSELDDKALAKQVGRPLSGVENIRKYAVNFKKGDMRYITQTLQKRLQVHFQTAEGKTETRQVTTQDNCEKQLETVLESASQMFENLKEHMGHIAEITVNHKNHELMQRLEDKEREIKELNEWRMKVTPELEGLRQFKTSAQESNFAWRIRKAIQK